MLDRRRVVAGILGSAATTGCAGAPSMPGGVQPIPRPNQDVLGEGTLWSRHHHSLYWIDMLRPALWTLDPATGMCRYWPMPDMICWIAERQSGTDLIIGLHRTMARFSLGTGEVQVIATLEPNLPRNRLNDAKVDRWGRIWAGTMREGGGGDGSLYRIDRDFTWSRQDAGYLGTNGPTFSPDGHILYHSDSPRGLVYAFDLDAAGTLSNKRIFARFPPQWGLPDGMTTDRQGGIWICHFGGGRVSRFLPSGVLDRSITVPATLVTDCCFGGEGYSTLYITTGSIGHEAEAGGGKLYRIRPGEKGMPPHRFAG